jgi:hypothetical protein
MARPRKVMRSIEKTICLPENLVAKVELELFSEVDGKVPFGAWQKFVVARLEEYFARKGNGNGN